jgi:3-phytase
MNWVRRALAAACVLGLTVNVAGAFPAAGATAGQAQTVRFSPIADARIEEAHPATNFGMSTGLLVDDGPELRSFLKFEVTGLMAPIVDAKIRLYAFEATTNGPMVYETGTAWQENEVTWNNRPFRTGNPSTDAGAIAVGWVELDVTPIVTANGTYSFALFATSIDGVDFYSREASSNPPELLVTTAGAADTTPPSVSLTSPAAGTTYTSPQTATVSAAASDDTGVAKVEFYDNGVLRSADTTSPYSHSWSITSADNGSHDWTARAYDAAGNSATSALSTVVVAISAPPGDTAPPSVSMTAPPSGTTYSSPQTVTVSASASDDTGVSRVEFYDNGVLRSTDTSSPYSYSWSITSADNGSHDWTGRAFDAAGNSAASAPSSVTVSIVSGPVADGPITPTAETDPVAHSGDAADDPAVWIHPTDPSSSTIIGTDKLGALNVYDLAGRRLHAYPDGHINNVDLRYGFPLAGQRVALVAASDVGIHTIRIYKVDTATRGLVPVHARDIAAGIGLYGLCIYRSPTSGKYFVFDADSSGHIQQWELFDNGSGKVDARKVRDITVSSVVEGCVADDETGNVYFAQEDVALWRYGAEPDAGSTRTSIDTVGSGGHLTADIEGLTIYYRAGGAGYLIASSQGSDDFAVYDRQTRAYLGRFAVVPGTIDGVSHTDGIDVTNFGLGSAFPEGAFIAQDDANGSSNQNFKLVPWGRIARARGLAIDTGWDPRDVGSPSPAPVPPPAGGTVYYLDSASGNDANSGTSPSTAWQTLAHASGTTLSPGDSLLLARGGTWTGPLDLTESGTSSSPITIGAYGSGAAPVIQGSSSCVLLSGSYLTLRALHVDDCSWAGVQVSGTENRVEENVITRHVAGVYIRAGAVGTAVLHNELRDNNKMSVLTPGGSDDSGAFAILLHGDASDIAYNTISGSDAFSYDYGRDGAAVEIYGGKSNRIHYNVAIDNDAFTELGNARASDNTFAYNVVRSALETSTGFVTRGAASSYGPVLRTTLLNNTVYLTGASSQGFVCHAGCGPDILRMRNNIVVSPWKVGYADAPFDEDYDLFSGGGRQFTLGPNSAVAYPFFVDPVGNDFHLQANSPGVDAGVPVGYSSDLDGRAVPADGNGDGVAAVDLGAYER